jgi:hypothetical protein
MNETKDTIGDLIEELKRLQVEHNNVQIKKETNGQFQSVWPQPKNINGEIFIVF